jgi:hypothetical protein
MDAWKAMIAGAAALLVSGCSFNVDWRDSMPAGGRPSPPIHLPIYPGATQVTPPRPTLPGEVSFTGSFSDTSAYTWRFETEDDVAGVLRFYRQAMRRYGEPLGCRGTINVRAYRRTEELRCIREESDSVQLVVSGPGHHAIVSVAPAATGSRFTLVNLDTRH